jgi:hypothetical protein
MSHNDIISIKNIDKYKFEIVLSNEKVFVGDIKVLFPKSAIIKNIIFTSINIIANTLMEFTRKRKTTLLIGNNIYKIYVDSINLQYSIIHAVFILEAKTNPILRIRHQYEFIQLKFISKDIQQNLCPPIERFGILQ